MSELTKAAEKLDQALTDVLVHVDSNKHTHEFRCALRAQEAMRKTLSELHEYNGETCPTCRSRVVIVGDDTKHYEPAPLIEISDEEIESVRHSVCYPKGEVKGGGIYINSVYANILARAIIAKLREG